MKNYFKHLSVMIKSLVYLLFTSLFPKNKNLWLFGAWKGNSFSDNSKYLYEYVLQNDPNIRAVWVTKNSHVYWELKKRRYPVVKYPSLKANFLIAHAGYLFQTEGYKDIGEYPVGRSKVIQLWHGQPCKAFNWFHDSSILKRILINVENGRRSSFYWVSQSQFYTEFFHNEFKVPYNHFINTGLPRCDNHLLNANSFVDQLKEVYSTVALYLPTHRNWGENFDLDFIIRGLKELDCSLIDSDICLLYKPHPNEVDLVKNDLLELKNIILLDGNNVEYADIYSYLYSCDLLISDYSSVIYDYLLVNKPIILFTYDLETYQKEDSGLMPDYFLYQVGPFVNNWKDLATTLININVKDEWIEKRTIANNYFNEFSSDSNCKRLVESLKKLN